MHKEILKIVTVRTGFFFGSLFFFMFHSLHRLLLPFCFPLLSMNFKKKPRAARKLSMTAEEDDE